MLQMSEELARFITDFVYTKLEKILERQGVIDAKMNTIINEFNRVGSIAEERQIVSKEIRSELREIKAASVRLSAAEVADVVFAGGENGTDEDI